MVRECGARGRAAAKRLVSEQGQADFNEALTTSAQDRACAPERGAKVRGHRDLRRHARSERRDEGRPAPCGARRACAWATGFLLAGVAVTQVSAQTANSFWRSSLADREDETGLAAPATAPEQDFAAPRRPVADRQDGSPQTERVDVGAQQIRSQVQPQLRGPAGRLPQPAPTNAAIVPPTDPTIAPAPASLLAEPVLPPESLAVRRSEGGAAVRAVQPRLTDPRPRARVTPDDPFAAPGLRLGGLRLSPSLGVFGGMTAADEDALGERAAERFVEVEPEITLSTDWARHALEARLRARGRLGEDVDPTESYDYEGQIRARLDLGSTGLGTDTTVTLQAGARGQEGEARTTALPGGASLGGAGLGITDGLVGDVTALGTLQEDDQERAIVGSLDIAHELGRLDLGLTGEAERSDTSDRDPATTYRLSARAGLEAAQVSPFVEASVARTHFCDACGGDFDAIGGLAGLRLRDDRRLRGEAAIGYERRLDEDSATTESGLIWRGALTYEATPLVTFDLATEATLGDVDDGSSQAVTLGVTYLPRRWLTLTGGLAVTWEDFETLVDQAPTSGATRALTASLGAEYRINRFASIAADATQQRSRDGVTGEDAVESTVRLGVVLRR
ncbi:MAG: outer membrane beta-barrel protein [Pseudomonadota bacterium]